VARTNIPIKHYKDIFSNGAVDEASYIPIQSIPILVDIVLHSKHVTYETRISPKRILNSDLLNNLLEKESNSSPAFADCYTNKPQPMNGKLDNFTS
jgi:hypothetical protein